MSAFALAFGLSLSLVGCAGAASDDSASSAAASTGPQDTPSEIELSADGLATAGALLQQAAVFQSNPTSTSIAPFKAWLEREATDFYIESRGDAGRTFFFVAETREGDIVKGTTVLEIDEAWSDPELGPVYTLRAIETPVPHTATRLDGVESQALLALAGITRLAMNAPADPASVEFGMFLAHGMSLASASLEEIGPNQTRFVFSARLIDDGDVIVGETTLDLTATYEIMPEYEVVDYVATTTIKKM